MSRTVLLLIHKCYLFLILSNPLGIHFFLGILFCGAFGFQLIADCLMMWLVGSLSLWYFHFKLWLPLSQPLTSPHLHPRSCSSGLRTLQDKWVSLAASCTAEEARYLHTGSHFPLQEKSWACDCFLGPKLCSLGRMVMWVNQTILLNLLPCVPSQIILLPLVC